MDVASVLAIVGSAIALVGTVIALFLWNRSEANSDRRDLTNLILAMKEETSAFQMAVQNEMKDFHYQLLELRREGK